MQLDTGGAPDWGKGLPLDVLALVAGGRDLLKAMRLVNRSWQAGFDCSVTTMKVKFDGPLLPASEVFCKRFPMLTCLHLGESQMAEADLAKLDGLKRLSNLFLGAPEPYKTSSNKGRLVDRLTGEKLRRLFWLPLKHLDLGGCVGATCLKGLWGMELTSLNLSCCRLSDDMLQHLERIPLTSLKLGQMWSLPSFEGLMRGERLRGLPLTSLDLESAHFKSIEGLFAWPLTSLNLATSNLSDLDLKFLGGLPLTDLNISRLKGSKSFSGAGLEYLRDMPISSLNLRKNENLLGSSLAFLKGLPITSLKIGGCNKCFDRYSLAHLVGLPLRGLDLSLYRWSDRPLGVKGLELLRGMSLTDLDLSNCYDFHNSDLEHLKGMSELASLNLEGCFHISDVSILSALPLTSLRLDFCPFQDWGLESLRKMPLNRLSLNYCNALTDACLEGIKCIQTLQFVELQGCDAVSFLTISDLKRAGLVVQF